MRILVSGKRDQSLASVNPWSSAGVHGHNYQDKINGTVFCFYQLNICCMILFCERNGRLIMIILLLFVFTWYFFQHV